MKRVSNFRFQIMIADLQVRLRQLDEASLSLQAEGGCQSQTDQRCGGEKGGDSDHIAEEGYV